MKRLAGILSVLLILSACFGVYKSVAGIKDIASSKDYWEQQAVQAKDNLTKLDDGIALLGENEQAYIDGVNKVAEGEKALAKGKAALSSGKKQLANGKKAFAEGKKKLTAGRAEVAAGEKKLAKAKVLLENGKKQLDEIEESGLQQGIADFDTDLATWSQGYTALMSEKSKIAKKAAQGAFDEAAAQFPGGDQVVAVLRTPSTPPTKYKASVEKMINIMSEVEITKETEENKSILQEWLEEFQNLVYGKTLLADSAQQISSKIAANDTLRESIRKAGGARAMVFLESLAYDLDPGIGKKIISYIKQADIEDVAKANFMSYIENANQMLQTLSAGIDQKKAEYQQGLKDYAAGQKKLAAGKAQLEKGEKVFTASKTPLAKGEKDVTAGEVKVADGEAQLAEGKAQLARYEDGEAQLIYGLKIALALEGYTGVDSIKARLGNNFSFMKANNKNVNLTAAGDVVKAGRDMLSDTELKLTDELTPKFYGNIAVIIASALALIGGLLGLMRKYVAAGIAGGLAAASAGIGAAFFAKAGTEMAEIAGSSLLGTSLYIGAFTLLAVGVVHAIINLAAKKKA